MKPTLYKALYFGEWLKVIWLDYEQEKIMLHKDLPEQNTHATYIVNFSEVTFKRIRRKKILSREEWEEKQKSLL